MDLAGGEMFIQNSSDSFDCLQICRSSAEAGFYGGQKQFNLQAFVLPMDKWILKSFSCFTHEIEEKKPLYFMLK